MVRTSEREQMAYRVIHAVSEIKGVPPTKLSPLTESIDPDALNTLFFSTAKPTELRFEYEGCTVLIDEHGEIAVTQSK